LSDDTSAGNTVLFGISSDNGTTWTVTTTTVSGNIGANQQAGARTFTWEAGTDFPNQTSATMRVRVRAIDTYGNSGSFAQSSAFSLDSAPPALTNIHATQTLGTNQVSIVYDISEFSTTSTVALDISSDGGISWNVATSTLAGALGANIVSGVNKIVAWNAGTDDPNEESSNMRVRLRATDVFNNTSTYAISSNFALDTRAPINLANFIKFASTNTSATFHWSPATDANFSKYELWYGPVSADVESRTSTANLWGTVADPFLTQRLTVSTVMTNITVQADFFVEIFAFDAYGHMTTLPVINIFTPAPQTPAPTPTPTTPPPAGTVVPPPSPSIIPPRRPLLSPFQSPINETTLTVSGLADPGTRIDLYDNGGFLMRVASITDANGRFFQTILFSEGPHILTARAVDVTNVNSGFSDPLPFLVDITSPDAPHISSPTNNETVSERTPIIFGVSEPLADIEVTLDTGKIFHVSADAGGNWILIVPSDTVFPLGSHTVSATAFDQAGNRGGTASITMAIVSLPSIPSPSPGAPIISVPSLPVVTLPILAPEVFPLKKLSPGPQAPVVVREVTEAIELPGLPAPKVEKAQAIVQQGNAFEFSGTALPNQEVVVYLHSQAVLYQTRADEKGIWKVRHEQDRVELTPGDHAIFAIALNRGLKIKSRPSSVGIFKVEKNFWVMMFQYLHLQTTIITIGVLLVTIGALYGIKRRERRVTI